MFLFSVLSICAQVGRIGQVHYSTMLIWVDCHGGSLRSVVFALCELSCSPISSVVFVLLLPGFNATNQTAKSRNIQTSEDKDSWTAYLPAGVRLGD
jgi:hypothetical protein